MKQQKSKFWTFIFALIPGAAQMYMGLMLRGLSLMACAVFIIMLATFTSSIYFAFLFPLVWFYAFFDAINLRGLSEEHFQKQTDEPFYTYLFPLVGKTMPKIDFKSKKLKIAIGITTISIGAYAMFFQVIRILNPFLPEDFYYMNSNFIYYLPRVAVSGILIWIGIRLIRGKRKELDNNEE